jgi:hypothetical protein
MERALNLASLKQQLKHHTQQDTLRVNRLNELGMIRSVSVGLADTVSDEALSLSKKINYLHGERMALIARGTVKFNQPDLMSLLFLNVIPLECNRLPG